MKIWTLDIRHIKDYIGINVIFSFEDGEHPNYSEAYDLFRSKSTSSKPINLFSNFSLIPQPREVLFDYLEKFDKFAFRVNCEYNAITLGACNMLSWKEKFENNFSTYEQFYKICKTLSSFEY